MEHYGDRGESARNVDRMDLVYVFIMVTMVEQEAIATVILLVLPTLIAYLLVLRDSSKTHVQLRALQTNDSLAISCPLSLGKGKHRCRLDIPILLNNYLNPDCLNDGNLYLDVQYECYQVRSDEEIKIDSLESIKDTPLRELYSGKLKNSHC